MNSRYMYVHIHIITTLLRNEGEEMTSILDPTEEHLDFADDGPLEDNEHRDQSSRVSKLPV